MPKATITITDTENDGINLEVDFGEAYDENSQAHGMIVVLAESVLGNAKRYEAIEDTAPEVDVEPSRIIV
jgi:hypothetical protein